MVGFCDLVGTGIAPVSRKTAVKSKQSRYKQKHRICSSHFRVKCVCGFTRFLQRHSAWTSISNAFENESCAIADVQKLLLFEGFELMLFYKAIYDFKTLDKWKNILLAFCIIIENEMRANNNSWISATKYAASSPTLYLKAQSDKT